MTCINCGRIVTGNFCSHCCQPAHVKRITLKEGWNDFWSRIYGFDGKFPRTIRDLTVRPGLVAKEIMQGNRVKYYGPVGYFFLMLTLYLVVLSLLNIDLRELISENSKQFSPGELGAGQDKFVQEIQSFVSRNMRIISIIIMPFNAIAARYLLFRKSNLNFVEHMVVPFFISGHLYWLGLISVVIYKITGSLFMNAGILIVTLLYFGFSYTGLITYQPRWKSFIKGIGVLVIGQLIIGVVAILAVGLLAYFVPEVNELIKPSNNR
jgi:hypothetical protein